MSNQSMSVKQILITMLGLFFLLIGASCLISIFDDTLADVSVLVFTLCFFSIICWAGIFIMGLRRFPLYYSIGPVLLVTIVLYVVAKPKVENTATQNKIATAEVSKFNLMLMNRLSHAEQIQPLTADALKPLATGHMGVLEGFLKHVLADYYQLQLTHSIASTKAMEQLLSPNYLAANDGLSKAQNELASIRTINADTHAKTEDLLVEAKAEASLLNVPDGIRKNFTLSFFDGLERRQEQLKITLEYETKIFSSIDKLYAVLRKYRKDWLVEDNQFAFKTELAYREFYTVQLELNQVVQEYQRYQMRNLQRVKQTQ